MFSFMQSIWIMQLMTMDVKEGTNTPNAALDRLKEMQGLTPGHDSPVEN